jgi:hypothetical protein
MQIGRTKTAADFSKARRACVRNAAAAGRGNLGIAGFAWGVLWLLSGCQAPAQPSGPTEMVLHVPDYEAFLDGSLTVLRLYDFPPDRVDRTRGLIVSHPTTSGQFFEWWRVDSRGGYQTLESSLHTMRRIVTVNIVPAGNSESASAPAADESGGLYRVRVQVDKSRYSAPERQITTTSGALAIYSERVPTVEGLRGPQSRGAQWVPLGRDALLESFLLAKLSDALADVTPAQ